MQPPPRKVSGGAGGGQRERGPGQRERGVLRRCRRSRAGSWSGDRGSGVAPGGPGAGLGKRGRGWAVTCSGTRGGGRGGERYREQRAPPRIAVRPGPQRNRALNGAVPQVKLTQEVRVHLLEQLSGLQGKQQRDAELLEDIR